MGWECFIASKAKAEHFIVAEKLKDDEDRNRKLQPQEEFELYRVDEGHMDRHIRIEKILLDNIHTEIGKLLLEFQDAFSQSATDLGTMSQDVAERARQQSHRRKGCLPTKGNK